MITEDYVGFETAKLLKEEGFDEVCEMFYCKPHEGYMRNRKRNEWRNSDLRENITCTCPTLQMAMKWLREVHSIFIDIISRFSMNADKDVCFSYSCKKLTETYKSGYEYEDGEWLSYEEAAEAAIKYCLKNLIKNEDEEEESDISVPKTVNEAIYTLEKILSDEDREYLLKNGAISMHDSLGRWIRNEWGLWTGSELKDELMNMNKDLNHPDDMSNYIIEEFIKYWNNKI